MKEFNLEKALNGEPVKLRGGYKAFVKFDLRKQGLKYNGDYPLVGFYIDGEQIIQETWQYNGRYSSHFDIVGMWEEPRPRVKLDLPAPLKEAENGQEVFFVNLSSGIVVPFVFDNSTALKKSLLEAGLFFTTREEAEEWINAVRNSRR